MSVLIVFVKVIRIGESPNPSARKMPVVFTSFNPVKVVKAHTHRANTAKLADRIKQFLKKIHKSSADSLIEANCRYDDLKALLHTVNCWHFLLLTD